MKKIIITSLFAGIMSLASFVVAEEPKEEAEESIQVVSPTVSDEGAQPVNVSTTETTNENK